MHGRCLLIALLMCLLFAPTSSLPQSHALPPPVGGITFEQVIKLSQSGLSDAVIIAQIKKRPQPFDLSPDQLLQLKNARVSDAVIEAMMPPSSAPAITTPSVMTTASQGVADDPLADHEPGIYVYYTTRDGKRTLVEIEPTVYSQGKGGGTFTYKWKAVVRSPHAAISTGDRNPTFYFYSEKQFGQSLNHTAFSGMPSTPHEFTLLQLHVKKDSRETVVMRVSGFGSLHTGAEDKTAFPFTFTKIRPGVYKVTPNAPLYPGEYCFLSGMYGYKIFDFGITE
jgi:hypothetical protein